MVHDIVFGLFDESNRLIEHEMNYHALMLPEFCYFKTTVPSRYCSKIRRGIGTFIFYAHCVECVKNKCIYSFKLKTGKIVV